MVRETKVGHVEVRGRIGASEDGTGISSQMFADRLKAVGAVDEVRVFVSSNGGSVSEGYAMYRLLQRFSARKVVEVEGIAASAASYFILAADSVEMGEFSVIMIHSASSPVYGNATELRKVGSILDKLDANIAATYEARTGIPAAEWLKLMAEETYLDAQEALSLRLVDKVIPGYRPPDVNANRSRMATRTGAASLIVQNMRTKRVMHEQDSTLATYLANLNSRAADVIADELKRR